MKTQNRRRFIIAATLSGAALTASARVPTGKKKKGQIMHHVLFWLKKASSKEDLDKLIGGLRSLKKIETLRKLHIGVPAATELRPVVDNTYSVSALFIFDDVAGQNTYQVHPLHKAFVNDCSPLWERIQVYDAMEV